MKTIMTTAFRIELVCWATFVLAFATTPYAAAGELHTWTDESGKYKIDAEFVAVEGANVRLKRRDGRNLSLPIAKLSKPDQKYLKELVKSRKGGGDPNNPFEAGLESEGRQDGGRAQSGRGPKGPGGFRVGDRVQVRRGGDWSPGTVAELSRGAGGNFLGVRMDGSDDVDNVIAEPFFIRRLKGRDPGAPGGRLSDLPTDWPVDEADMSNVRRVVPLGEPTGAFTPDPATPLPAGWRLKPTELGAKRGFFEKPVAVAMAAPETGLCVVVSTGGAGAGDDPSRVEVCNLRTGSAGEGYSAPRKVKLANVSPSGKRLLTVSEGEGFDTGPVQTWTLGKDKLTHVKSWEAGGGDRGRGLKWLAWLDDQRALTLDGETLTLWQVDDARAVYQIPAEHAQSAAFSPGRRQIALVTMQGVDVYSVDDGELLARLKPDRRGAGGHAAFSPSGQRLAVAVAGGETVSIYDLTNGEKLATVYARSAHALAKNLQWLGDDYVLTSGSDLIHVPDEMTVWTYDHHADHVVPLGDKTCYFFNDHASGRRAILPFALPHGAALKSNTGELALKPGDPVSLEVEQVVDLTNNAGTGAPSATDALTQALLDAGYKVEDGAPNKLVARTSPGETEQMAYRSFGIGGQTQNVSVTGRVYELELVADGQVVWSRKSVQRAPHHLRLEKDETIDQAVERIMQPNHSYFGATIPARVMAASQGEQRKSTLSLRGIE